MREVEEALPASIALKDYEDDSGSENEDDLLPLPASSNSHQSGASSALSRLLPRFLIRGIDAASTWIRGPDPPRPYKIAPLWPSIQSVPIAFIDRVAPSSLSRTLLFLALLLVWVLAFTWLQRPSLPIIAGYGIPIVIPCAARPWHDNNDCGLDGLECAPFANASMVFACPSGCGSQRMFNQHPVGTLETEYRTLVVGGGDPQASMEEKAYRGDSFICAAAVHAGFLSNAAGGCGVLEYVGQRRSYAGLEANGVESIAFDSYFPMSFRFVPGTQRECGDSRWLSLALSGVVTALIGLFTTSAAMFSWSTFIIMFATVAFATDPPDVVGSGRLISIVIGRFLPACFCTAVIYIFTLKRTLNGLEAQMEKVVLWLVPAWILALFNYTLDYALPSRLTPHDLQQQTDKLPIAIGLVVLILGIVVGQAWCFRIEGRMPAYLQLYGLIGLTIGLLVAVPGLHLRIHHYILALLFLPGTSMQTRPSMVYQGLLFGLFINGIAKWGFAPILQSSAEMSIYDTSLRPNATDVIAERLAENITFVLGPLPLSTDHDRIYNGFSVLVNGVERLRTWGSHDTVGDWRNGSLSWTWTRHIVGLPEYFRFAYMSGKSMGDYTKPGVWASNGSWTPPDMT